MITVKIHGGLGNQLSAYAFGYAAGKSRGDELVLDVSDYDNGYSRPYMLDALNIAAHRKLTYKQTSNPFLAESQPSELYLSYDKIVYENKSIKNKNDLDLILNRYSNPYFSGYWHSPEFYKGLEADIRAMFTPANKSARLNGFLEALKDQVSVAVHIRRTNFVLLNWAADMDYYKAAIAYVRSIYPGAVFYIFSDDIQFVKGILGDRRDIRYVSLLGGIDADLDEFFCISACNHRILSPISSFSEWARRLNTFNSSVDVVYSKTAAAELECKITDGNKKEITFGGRDTEKWKVFYDGSAEEYRAEPDMAYAENEIIRHIQANDSDKALELLNGISYDAYSLDSERFTRFLSYYAIACGQAGGLEASERCFYRQKQYSAGAADFHYNYFLTLDKLEKHTESAVHAGMAAKLSGDSGMTRELSEIFEEPPRKLSLFNTVANTPKKHFIVCSLSKWGFHLDDMKSLSVILAMAGNKVTVISRDAEMKPVDTEGTSIGELVSRVLENKIDIDSMQMYSHGIDSYTGITARVSGEILSCCPLIIQNLFLSSDGLETVVITRNPDAVKSADGSGAVKYIFLDCDKSDMEYRLTAHERREYVDYMFSNTDISVFTDPEVFIGKIRDGGREKCLLFRNSAGQGESYKYTAGKYGFTPNYIASQELFELAEFILNIKF